MVLCGSEANDHVAFLEPGTRPRASSIFSSSAELVTVDHLEPVDADLLFLID